MLWFDMTQSLYGIKSVSGCMSVLLWLHAITPGVQVEQVD